MVVDASEVSWDESPHLMDPHGETENESTTLLGVA